MRHGVGAHDRFARGRDQSRACRHDAALLGRDSLYRTPCHRGHGRIDSRRRGTASGWLVDMDRADTGDACRPLGWLSVFRAWLEFPGHPQPQYVYVDCAGRWRRLCLQRCRHHCARPVPGHVPRCCRRRRCLLRGWSGDHGAGPSGSGPRTASP